VKSDTYENGQHMHKNKKLVLAIDIMFVLGIQLLELDPETFTSERCETAKPIQEINHESPNEYNDQLFSRKLKFNALKASYPT